MTDALAGKAATPRAVLTGSAPIADESEGMSYLQSVPRQLVTRLSAAFAHSACAALSVLLDGAHVG